MSRCNKITVKTAVPCGLICLTNTLHFCSTNEDAAMYVISSTSLQLPHIVLLSTARTLPHPLRAKYQRHFSKLQNECLWFRFPAGVGVSLFAISLTTHTGSVDTGDSCLVVKRPQLYARRRGITS
jgi:hypothetical protein